MRLKTTTRHLANYLFSGRDEPRPTLKMIFSAFAGGHQIHQPVHIVEEDVLRQLEALHPYNDNLQKYVGRSSLFPELLHIGPAGGLFFIICDDANRFIASLTLRPYCDAPNRIELSQISVHRNFQNFGLATRLLNSMQDHLNKNRPEINEIIINSFEDAGNRWLRPLIYRMADGFKARILERDLWTFEPMPLRENSP